MARRPQLDLDEFFPYLINRLGIALATGFLDGTLAPARLSIAMWRVLVALSGGARLRQVDLGERTSIDASTLSRMVTRLVKMGLVTRTRSDTSNREVEIGLTAKGAALLDRLIPVAVGYEKQALAGVAKADLAIVKRALRRMHQNLTAPGKQRP